MSADLDTVTPRESQAWVRMALGPVYAHIEKTGDYAEGNDRSILGEDDNGFIMAPKPGTDDWWEPFDLTKPEHKMAAEESRRRLALAFLDLER
jgi:hypothetical protein